MWTFVCTSLYIIPQRIEANACNTEAVVTGRPRTHSRRKQRRAHLTLSAHGKRGSPQQVGMECVSLVVSREEAERRSGSE